MNATTHRLSLGALAVILCLALPAGLLSLLSSVTTGEQIDAADVIAVARVSSMQLVEDPETTILALDVDEVLFGRLPGGHVRLTTEGRMALDVGDFVLVLFGDGGESLITTYPLRHDRVSLEWQVASGVTGLGPQGIQPGATHVPLAVLQVAILARKGGSLPSDSFGGPGNEPLGVSGPDPFEPNDDLASATPVTLNPPAPLTGMPTIISGVNIHVPTDVDYFQFQANSLTVVHAETLGSEAGSLNTLMGLFDATTGDLLAHDDDGGSGTYSKITHPIARGGQFAVAVESAPDPDLDFDGAEGTTTGDYALSLELETGSFIWNNFDMIAGLSPDGSFIEDYIGFRDIGGEDVLLVGTDADGWALEYDISATPFGATHVFGGAGTQLTNPGFTSTLVPISFNLGPYVDSAGLNRQGRGTSRSLVAYAVGAPFGAGVVAEMDYRISYQGRAVDADLTLQMYTHGQVDNLVFTRVLDADLFGTGADNFYWSFDPASAVKAFPVDTLTNVSNATPPGSPTGNTMADQQIALTVEHGSSTGGGEGDSTTYGMGFAYVTGFGTELEALQEAQRILMLDLGMTTWCVAVDQDTGSGEWSAFGAGLHDA